MSRYRSIPVDISEGGKLHKFRVVFDQDDKIVEVKYWRKRRPRKIDTFNAVDGKIVKIGYRIRDESAWLEVCSGTDIEAALKAMEIIKQEQK